MLQPWPGPAVSHPGCWPRWHRAAEIGLPALVKAGAAAGLWWLCVPCAPWAAAIGTGGHHRLLLSQDEHCTPWEGLNLPGAMADLAESVLISTNGFISVLSRSPEDCRV